MPNSDTSGTGTVSQPSQSEVLQQRNRWPIPTQSQSQSQGLGLEQEKEAGSQEPPIAQSLSYTSQSQSQGIEKLRESQMEPIEEEESAAPMEVEEAGVVHRR